VKIALKESLPASIANFHCQQLIFLNIREYVGIGQNYVIFVADILDSVKLMIMKADALVSPLFLLNLLGVQGK
jgi:outer membrane protein W